MKITSEGFKAGDLFLLNNSGYPPSIWTLEAFSENNPVFKGAGICSTEQPYMVPIPKGATQEQIKALLHILL